MSSQGCQPQETNGLLHLPELQVGAGQDFGGAGVTGAAVGDVLHPLYQSGPGNRASVCLALHGGTG